MKITIDEIKRLGKLSALTFSDDKLEDFVAEFQNIANFVEQVKEADLTTEEKFNRILKINELREDKVEKSLSQEEVLSNAPEKGEGAFVVPKVVD